MTIGVLTSGGDAPGMNAAIRAVVRTAIVDGMKVIGIKRGYAGLLDEEFIEMDSRSVGDILTKGGTMLLTARCHEFRDPEGVDRAARILKRRGIDALVVIGGDGSFRGAADLAERGITVVGVPATIDMDIACTDYTIGFDTAVNTAMEAIDKIRDTSASHERVAIIEVMGRHAGYIALYCGIANGAEEIMLPETYDHNEERIIAKILENRKKGKTLHMIVNAEGIGNSQELADHIGQATGTDARVTILGYMQRGGSPTCKDRVYASVMGGKAVEAIRDGKGSRVIAYRDGEFKDLDILDALTMQKTLPNDFLILSRKLIR